MGALPRGECKPVRRDPASPCAASHPLGALFRVRTGRLAKHPYGYFVLVRARPALLAQEHPLYDRAVIPLWQEIQLVRRRPTERRGEHGVADYDTPSY